jgi:hypothetical protein
MKLFKQRKAKLFNGDIVKLGDKISFVNSDGIKCTGVIKRKANGDLFFWNTSHDILEYTNAIKEETK